MTNKQTTPAPEIIRKAYIEDFLKRRPDAEDFAHFTETNLADFICRNESSDFAGIYSCLEHNFYDTVRNHIATNDEMRAEDDASDNMFSVHLKTWSSFLESKAFHKLLKTKNAAKTKTVGKKQQNDNIKTVFREETEGERRHVEKEMDVIRRNPQLRQMCLDRYGFQCQCCGMDFAKNYGENLGAGFIEVHHLKMISTFESEGVPDNFLENLVPLCSNCHSMIHHIKDSEHPLRDLRNSYHGTITEIQTWKED